MYSKETKTVLLTLYKNLVREQKKGSLLCSINKPLERASTLTGLSLTNIRKWVTEDETVIERKIKPSKLDSFEVDLIIRKVKEMFDSQQVITVRKLKKSLEEECHIVVGKTTLWRILKSKGFRFRKTNGNRRILLERNDLQKKRIEFLRKVKEARESNTNLVYLDETWINCHHTYPKEWMSEDGTTARLIPTGRGQRLILLHAVDYKTGFLPKCLLLFKSISTDGRDYHSEMNSVIFEDWLKNKLIPSLTETSCIIMDNAAYHSR